MSFRNTAKQRNRVRRLKFRRAQLEKRLLSDKPMVAGSLIERRFRPEGPVCYYLSIPTPQNSWHRYVRNEELEYYRKRAQSWQEFVGTMAEWVQVSKATERELRALGKGRCEKLEIRRGKK